MIRTSLRLFYEASLDLFRYMKSTPVWGKRQHRSVHIEGDIIRMYHVLEKGLAMPDFRPRYGIDMVHLLVQRIEQWEIMNPAKSNIHISAAKDVLKAYYGKHLQLNVGVEDIIPDAYRQRVQEPALGGVKSLPPTDPSWHDGFVNVVNSRTSVRNFDLKRLPDKSLINEAIGLAIRTPSVCNRQTWRVHAYQEDKAQEILSLQNGNRGFGHTIPTVLIVTVDLRYFIGAIERYQPWIDGGMFSMTLLLSLHSMGLGAVSLNWSVINSKDSVLREKAEIPNYERVIMLMGCGYPKANSSVPSSCRSHVSHFLTWHEHKTDL